MSKITIIRAPHAAEEAPPFRTSNPGRVRQSQATRILLLRYIEATKTIQAQCEDGKLRECRTARLNSEDGGAARRLWRILANATKSATPLIFFSAGSFSPDSWFYHVEAAE